MEALPDEIIIHIMKFLEPIEIVTLQLVCHRLHDIARDNNLWRTLCYDTSSWESQRKRRELTAINPPPNAEERHHGHLQRALGNAQTIMKEDSLGLDPRAKAHEKIRILANWDPSYSNETVDWYSEFIHRNAPITMSWLQQPRNRESNEHEPMEVRGAGIYNPPGETESGIAVGPLDDGSLCLWDLTGSTGKKGRIIGRSASGTLCTSGSSRSEARRSTMINTGVTECVSINSSRRKAFIAVQSDLIEVDLETLTVVNKEKFPFSISALSEAKGSTPITVGTNLSLHIHDPRDSHPGGMNLQASEKVDCLAPAGNMDSSVSSFRSLLDPPMPNYAPLFHPGPLSIIHMPTSTNEWDGNGEIYVAGRFPSILNYDRRYFPKIRGTIHSGSRLCSMTSIPHAFSAREIERMRRGELSTDQVDAFKSQAGDTLIAAGEYNSKGSLELYGLSPHPHLTSMSSDSSAGRRPQESSFKNRQTSSNSKLLSVSSHGTRIVFSDGGGNVKWVERDAFTEVRQCNINHGRREATFGIFGDLSHWYMDNGSGDIVRKILHIEPEKSHTVVNQDDLVLWTGEKIGLLSFSSKPGFTADSFEETMKTMEEVHREREERVYVETMRRALERQADEVRFVKGMGLGFQ